MQSLEIRRYAPAFADEWNQFVAASKNGTFLFDRRYMDYHSDRFSDHSLMIFRRGKLYALLPANVDGDTLYSHQGLTYGGLLMDERATAAEVVEIFKLLNAMLRSEGIRKIVYKPVPWIYHQQPAEEDLYAIVEVCDVRLTRSLSSTISREHQNVWYRIRQGGAQKAKQTGVVIEETEDYQPFWQILSANLQTRYGLKPVHTLEEIMLLHQRFPEHIRLFVAKEGSDTIGGSVLYVTDRVVHTQYIAASPIGREVHALDFLFDVVIRQALDQHAYFDFGISTENQGTYLNEGLIYQKEGFGGRGICYDWYKWTLE
jgi:hypothetical protein